MSKDEYRVRRFVTDRTGATAIEYAAAAAFIATAAIGVAGALNTTIYAESHATFLNGKVLLASSKQELARVAARSSSDPIQTGSTAEPDNRADLRATRARKAVASANSTPLCNAGEDVRPCKLDLNKESFQGWRRTILEWSDDQ